MDFTKFQQDKHALKGDRKYYGCIHCKSATLVKLDGHAGDPEGIRSDSGCLICGGVMGCCKSSSTSISRSEWVSEYEEEMPLPDRNKILAMKIIIKMEEKLGADFRDWEQDYANALSEIIKEHNEKLEKYVSESKQRLQKVREFVNG